MNFLLLVECQLALLKFQQASASIGLQSTNLHFGPYLYCYCTKYSHLPEIIPQTPLIT